MNMPKPDTFVLVVAALSEKLVQKENENHDLRQALTNAEEEVSYQRSERDRLYEEVGELRTETRNLRDTLDRQRTNMYDLEHYRTQNGELWTRIRQLESECYKLKYGGATPEEVASGYMKAEGGKVWADGNKIACIKEVRSCTGWGLKETKDWCEENAHKFAPVTKTG